MRGGLSGLWAVLAVGLAEREVAALLGDGDAVDTCPFEQVRALAAGMRAEPAVWARAAELLDRRFAGEVTRLGGLPPAVALAAADRAADAGRLAGILWAIVRRRSLSLGPVEERLAAALTHAALAGARRGGPQAAIGRPLASPRPAMAPRASGGGGRRRRRFGGGRRGWAGGCVGPRAARRGRASGGEG